MLAADEEALRVELWERGEFHGARRISSLQGTSQLRARRVALAAAALARRLRRKRLAEARLAARQKDEVVDEVAPRGFPLHGRFAIGAGALGAVVGPGDLWLAGPSLSAQLRFDSGARLDVGASWLVGGASADGLESGARWLEVSVAPGVAVPVGSLELQTGATVAAAAVHLSDVRAVDGVDGQSDTWSARLAAHLRFEGSLGGATRLHAGPEAGVVLRRIIAVDTAGDRSRLGGLWIGATLGVAIDPARPVARASSKKIEAKGKESRESGASPTAP